MRQTSDSDRSKPQGSPDVGQQRHGPRTYATSPTFSDSNCVVATHQPNYLPWLGLFHKLSRSDMFVILDDVEFTTNSWTNRNKIKTPDGWTWLTVPVHDSGGPINEVEIVTNESWRETHRKSLKHNYGKAPYFDTYEDRFTDIYETEWERLGHLNITLLQELISLLDIDCHLIYSSEFDVDSEKTTRLVDLCTALEADCYFSGEGAKSYLQLEQFTEADIEVVYQSFDHPEYDQRFGEFVPNLSVVDALFNIGAEATKELLENA